MNYKKTPGHHLCIQDSTDKTVNEIQEILSVINKVDAVVDSIASAVQNQTEATNSSKMVRQSAGDLNTLTAQMKEITDRFKV